MATFLFWKNTWIDSGLPKTKSKRREEQSPYWDPISKILTVAPDTLNNENQPRANKEDSNGVVTVTI